MVFVLRLNYVIETRDSLSSKIKQQVVGKWDTDKLGKLPACSTTKILMAGKKMVSIGTMYRESIGLKDVATSIPP